MSQGRIAVLKVEQDACALCCQVSIPDIANVRLKRAASVSAKGFAQRLSDYTGGVSFEKDRVNKQNERYINFVL